MEGTKFIEGISLRVYTTLAANCTWLLFLPFCFINMAVFFSNKIFSVFLQLAFKCFQN